MAKRLWNLIAAVLGRPKTQICNNSDKHIFLIPISCLDDHKPRKSGRVVDDGELPRVIPPGKSIEVDSCKYDYNDRDPGSQIYILFRAGGHSNVKKFLGDLPKNKNRCVQVEEEENLFLHFDLLGWRKLSLKCDEAGLVKRDVKNAGQVDAAETQNQSELVDLIKKMQHKQKDLEEENAALRAKIKSLKIKLSK